MLLAGDVLGWEGFTSVVGFEGKTKWRPKMATSIMPKRRMLCGCRAN